jgi:hypothetical protein
MPAQMPTAPADNPKKGVLAQDAKATQEGAAAAKANQRALGSASSIRDIRPRSR